MSSRSRSWKIAKRALGAVGALALVLVLAVSLTLGTRVGRNLLLVQALVYVNEAIPGRVQVLDFSELSLSSLELRGIAIFDPAGNQVLSLGLVRLEADLLARTTDPDDARLRRLVLTPHGSDTLESLSAVHRSELRRFYAELAPILNELSE